MLIGGAYAYFTAGMSTGETQATLKVGAGQLKIKFANTNSVQIAENVQPTPAKYECAKQTGAYYCNQSECTPVGTKYFTLTGTNTTSGLAMPYEVGLDYISRFSDGMIHYYIKRTNTNSNVTSDLFGTANQAIPGNTSETGYTHGTLKKGNRYVKLAAGEFNANTTNQTITFNLILQLKF